jgi:hypothetical protein
VQVVLTLAVVAFAGRTLWRQWADASRIDVRIDVQVGALLAASAIVLGTYLMLVETWRQVLARLGAPVGFGPATRVWFASNLGKYIPGKIWTVTAMVVMIGKSGVPAAAAGASVVVTTIATATTGFAVVMFTSMKVVREITGGTIGVEIATIGMALSLAAAPILARQWNRLAVKLGREQLSVEVPYSAVVVALVGSGISWWTYGFAFKLLVHAIFGEAPGPTSTYVAAYSASYLVGLLTLFAPGGIGAREMALTLIMPALGLATAAQSVIITVTSRVWLTVLELVPSVIAATRTVARKPPG